MTEKLKFISERVENIVGTGENAGNQHFLLFPRCFQKGFFLRVAIIQDCVIHIQRLMLGRNGYNERSLFLFS